MQQLGEFAGQHGMGTGPLRNLMKSVLLVPQGEKTHTHSHSVVPCHSFGVAVYFDEMLATMHALLNIEMQ